VVVRNLVRRNSPSKEEAVLGSTTGAKSLIDAGAYRVYGNVKDGTLLNTACAGTETVVMTTDLAMHGRENAVGTVDRCGSRT
jgi:hypothetical protein